MSRSEKQTNLLVALEAEFERDLRTALVRVASGVDTGFFFTAWSNPHRLAHLSEASAELDQVADEILRLRQNLGLTEPCPATWFREAIQVHADLENANRLGPIRLAEQLLKRLDELHAS